MKQIKFDYYRLFLSFFYLSILIFSFISWGHSSDHENATNSQLALDLFDEAVRLSPRIMDEKLNSATTPYIKVGSQKVYMNSHFWELVGVWLRIYKQDLSKDCECNFTAKELIEGAKDYRAGGHLSSLLSKKTTELTGEGIYFTAKYGYVFTALKVSAEVAETILSIFIGGKGIHVLCTVIDGLLFYTVRMVQDSFQKYKYSHNLSRSGLFLTFKNAWISYRVHRARKQIFFEIKEIAKLNEDKAAEIDSLGRKKNRRAQYLEEISKLMENKQEHLNDENFKQANKLDKAIEKKTRVRYKHFFGHRYKRWLLLFSRKYSSEYLYGKEDNFDKIFKDKKAYPFLIQEGILNASFDTSFETNPLPYQADDIKEGLIKEFTQSKNLNNEEQKQLEKSLQIIVQDFDKIFDASISSFDRHVTVGTIEVFLNLFLNYYLTTSLKPIQQNEKTSILERFKLYYLKGQYNKEVLRFINFLSVVASSTNAQKVSFYKYESMETFLLFLSYFDRLKSLSDLKKPIETKVLIQELKDYLEKIRIISLGTDKKSRMFAINPFTGSLPQCRNLVRKR